MLQKNYFHSLTENILFNLKPDTMKNTINTLGSLERDYHNQVGASKYCDYLVFKKGKTNNEKREFLLNELNPENVKGLNIKL